MAILYPLGVEIGVPSSEPIVTVSMTLVSVGSPRLLGSLQAAATASGRSAERRRNGGMEGEG